MRMQLAGMMLAAAAAWADPAAAQAPAPPAQVLPGPPMMDPTAHRHVGFYLNLGLGFGHLKSTASTVLGDAEVSGGGGVFTIAAGGAISENLIIAGHFWDSVASSPTVKLGTLSASTSTDTSASLYGFGPSLVYYFMPTNLYIQVTPSITKMTLSQGGSSASTESGLGLWLALGKEWYVSDHWGIGFAVNVALSSNKDTGTNPPTWKSNSFGLILSASYD